MNADEIEKLFMRLGQSKISKGDKNVVVTCPLARWTHEGGEDHHPSLSVKIEPDGSSVFICFSCDSRGTIPTLLAMLQSHGVVLDADLIEEVLSREKVDLKARALRAVDRFDFNKVMSKKKDLAPFSEKELDKFRGKLHPYILGRGVTLDVCRTWGVGWDEDDQRLIFPVRRLGGALVGIVGRVVVPNRRPKYKNYLNFPKSAYLYGEHFLDRDYDKVILVEGLLDVLRMQMFGFRNVMATLGIHLSSEQKKKVLGFGKPIYLMWDWDAAGEQGKSRAITMLRDRIPLFDVKGPFGSDPGDLGKETLEGLIQGAKLVL